MCVFCWPACDNFACARREFILGDDSAVDGIEGMGFFCWLSDCAVGPDVFAGVCVCNMEDVHVSQKTNTHKWQNDLPNHYAHECDHHDDTEAPFGCKW